ncbi:DUF5629 family protein [Stutzerimonas nitrititolerans]|uniref:DUF5629 family protein n=1 Tax=Stutzerimonas nitrititolerans TaxID=2482751 RepID=UPI0028AC0470|nr:DUF5629 family protein [Stutzerimonas nitrititolerans]
MNDTPYLLDQLESADMLEVDGLHASDFSLDEQLLDEADAAAEADQPFSSEAVVLRIEALDGRQRRQWQFSYNQVMEALYQPEDDNWQLEGGHRLRCFAAIGAVGDD